ncbi:sigma-54-dependent transcriptional regulator [Pedobacter sp. BAL39]|uniref:sigma-54 interaction domain-containing protein n=1 Tax=Pedobacter sp. BAL39 TaxID=391596 RepID=UPI000155946C|nr:sigma-54 dependent transcriptional regulator [Pedobacter sp. BAL39]EDM35194.1 sigma-54-dependent transcriptional regulator [Pedobacter sp. BAL39]
MKNQQTEFATATIGLGAFDHSFNLREFLEVLVRKLCPLFSIDCVALVLYDEKLEYIRNMYCSVPPVNGMRNVEVMTKSLGLSGITAEIAGYQFPVLKSHDEWVDGYGENHCVSQQGLQYKYHCYIPLEINNMILGTLELHNDDKHLSQEGMSFCCTLADLLAELVDSKLPALQMPAHLVTDNVEEDRGVPHYAALIALSNALLLVSDEVQLEEVVGRQLLQFSFIADHLLIYPVDHIAEHAVFDNVISAGVPVIIPARDMRSVPVLSEWLVEAHDDVVVGTAMYQDTALLGLLYLRLKNKEQSAPLLELIGAIAAQLTLALNNLRYRQELAAGTAFFPLTAQDRLEYAFPEIVGGSPQMQEVFNLMGQVAPSTATVLILGETGVGKELIAGAIHQASDRAERQMVRINCAAIPANLIESELFGHEKGSFTGATDRRTGKFELADQSTIFLDEIGELSLDLQVKLLRVLQEKEFERIGGSGTISVDVRVIAATNRNLLDEVEAGRFRMDLYYRLNVFPISLPSLRDRRADIPLLANFFLERYKMKSGKKISGFSQKVMSAMMKYRWPGNIRELEHLIERQVILTEGTLIRDLDIPAAHQVMATDGSGQTEIKTIAQNERDHIFSVLRLCNGKISGKNGAAKLLGVPATTLNSKIKKLGLSRQHHF